MALLCCHGGPCAEISAVMDGAAGLVGGEDCRVELAYVNGWVSGDVDCAFDVKAREPGTHVQATFRCPVEEPLAPASDR